MNVPRALLVALCLSTPLPAQVVVARRILSTGGEVVIIDDDEEGGDGTVVTQAGVPAGATAAAAETPRLQKLRALVYDRRPSSILKAWATPPAPASDAASPTPTPDPVPGAAPEPAAGGSAGDGSSAAAATPSDPVNADPLIADPAATVEPVEKSPEQLASEAEQAAAAEAAAQKSAAEQAARVAAAEAAAKQAAEQQAIEREAQALQRHVTLGEWADVRTYLAGLSETEGQGAWRQLSTSLLNGPQPPQQPFQEYAEKNHFAPEDVTGLAEAAPFALEKPDLLTLGGILRQCIESGALLEVCLTELRRAAATPDGRIDRRNAARLLMAAAEPIAAGEFLPGVDEARDGNDREALNLLARSALARFDQDGKTEHLEQAWQVNQAVLASGEVTAEDKEEGLKRAVELAPRIRAELGQAWLDESFTARPERGMEILATIGGFASRALKEQARDADLRHKSLELQSTAAKALLQATPERAAEWRATLNLLADNWAREADFTYRFDQSTQRGPARQRDYYGNFFYYEQQFNNRGNMPAAITTGKILDIRPSDAWLALIDAATRPRLDMLVAQLLLKVGEENEAFPYIERLAAEHPDLGKDLVDEFLRVWARNHDPNSESRRTSSYMFVYGFEERANSIPLTRSKQERNLTELADWVTRLRRLPVEIDEELLTGAFTAAHSTAEVYRIETIERVLGALTAMQPATLAQMVQRMRANLVEVWRDPATQKDKHTRRRQKDIQQEVLRGYDVAKAVTAQALERHADDWSLRLAAAALDHDENDYRQEIEKSSEFAPRREAAFERFQAAADAYRAAQAERSRDDESADVYESWFYASLGACDLGAIDDRKQPVERQFPRIRAAIDALPGEAAERHRGMFANSLFTRMSSVNPAVKFRYVRAGLAVAGDHERAAEAREVFDYYKDLVTEIRLETQVDGSDRVGHDEPFGVLVQLRHTREIEREAGGFSKYLTNQNAQSFAYNYGRPTEDYRDKFEQAARDALAEHFEVLSVTFNHPDVHSRADDQYGWRTTPYAYLLLKPRGAEVDRVPSLRLDLDFLDTTGYAVIPIESPPLPIDASAAIAPARPCRDLRITQTLDERQATKGKLLLEVKATARGLLPKLDGLLDLAPDGFRVSQVDDQGVAVAEFDKEGDAVAVVCDRTIMVTLEGRTDLPALPTTFRFGAARAADTTMEYQRFVDADLARVGPEIALEQHWGETDDSTWQRPALIGGGVLLLGLSLALLLRRLRRPRAVAARFRLPAELTPFTVIGLLRDIHHHNGLDEQQSGELFADIGHLERCYFADAAPADAPDLDAIARRWLARTTTLPHG